MARKRKQDDPLAALLAAAPSGRRWPIYSFGWPAHAPRKEYARQAQVMSKIQRLLLDVLRDMPRWRAFALKIKQDNIKRPAFQKEFAKAVQGWRELKPALSASAQGS